MKTWFEVFNYFTSVSLQIKFYSYFILELENDSTFFNLECFFISACSCLLLIIITMKKKCDIFLILKEIFKTSLTMFLRT